MPQLEIIREAPCVNLHINSVVTPVDDEHFQIPERCQEVQILQIVESDLKFPELRKRSERRLAQARKAIRT